MDLVSEPIDSPNSLSNSNISNEETESHPDKPADITDIININVIAATGIYQSVLDKFGKTLARKFLKDASDDEKETFIKRLKEAQSKKMDERLTLIMNRIHSDYIFIKSHEEIMSSYKTIEDLGQDIETSNNHLQSVENETSILQRDTDMAIDKLENICETILMMPSK